MRSKPRPNLRKNKQVSGTSSQAIVHTRAKQYAKRESIKNVPYQGKPYILVS